MCCGVCRYDEWVKADRIIWPAEKGTKKRQRKRLKHNKEKEEEENEEEKTAVAKPVGAKRGRPQIRTTPTAAAANRSVSKTPSSEGRAAGKGSRMEPPSNMSNGDNTPRRQTRRTSGMYDSDRASNEDSGNSSDDSQSEEPPDKKPPCCAADASQEQDANHEEQKPAEVTNAATSPSNTVVTTATVAAVGQLTVAPTSPCPSMHQEQADKISTPSEKREEPPVDASTPPVHLDKDSKTFPAKMSPLENKMSAHEAHSRTSPLPDKASRTCPPPLSRTCPADKHKMAAVLDKQPQLSCPPPEPTEDEDGRFTPLSSPKGKGRRVNLRETGSETPPRIPHCAAAAAPSPTPSATASPIHTPSMSSPPRSVLKRQDEPMVVLHCLSAQQLLPEPPTAAANSDTDSATEEEEEEEGEEEWTGGAAKRKAAEHRLTEKKLRPDRRQEEATPTSPKTPTAPPKMAAGASPKALQSPVRKAEPERRSDTVIKLEGDKVSEGVEGGAVKEAELKVFTPPITPEAPCPPAPEELMPQMGPEALVCHEVDLDEPDEKEKPAPSPAEPRLLNHLPPLPHLLHTSLPSPHTPLLPQTQTRPFLPSATPGPAPCPDIIHPAGSAAELERRLVASGEPREDDADSSPGFSASVSSSTSSSSLQDSKDRGQKRVMDGSSSPSAKKPKRNQKRGTTAKLERNGAGHSSDSEDQARLSSLSKAQKSRCPALPSPSSHSKDKQAFPSPQRTYKWTFQLDALDGMSSAERISFLQEKLQEIRKYYLSLKSEVASIDRRRKRLKKKEREVSNTTASTSSGSSDTGMSPSSASPTQNTVAVECR